MGLPNQTELLKLFSAFLIEAGLSAVSIKNYLSDLRHFFSFCSQTPSGIDEPPTPQEVFRDIDKYLDPYLEEQKASLTPTSTTNRRLASIRRFSTFLDAKFGIPNVFTHQNISNNNISENKTTNISTFTKTDQNTSRLTTDISTTKESHPIPQTVLSTSKILDRFKSFLEKEKKSHSTIKNYLSDLNHFFAWTANQTPYTTQNLVNILSEPHLQAYITYLKLTHTSTSVINRRQSSIKKLAKFSHAEGYIQENPFELKPSPPKIAPLAWIERLSRKPKKQPAPPKSRIAKIYDRYHALPWSPYLNLAILILATTAMAIFAYNQIIGGAGGAAAITALTPPNRQLSFQGRLTDSGATPITTAVNVIFRLFDQQTPGGTELYSSGTCSIDPDQDGIFNTLIGDGVCGDEIPASVFTENRDVFLEIQVGTETLTPRQQIATVGFALNSETLQGYPASASATINTVPVIDNDGNINIAVDSPSIISTSGTFSLVGQNLAFQTAANSGGDIIFQPDALGSGQILAIGGTTEEDSFRITNANLTTGSLISGYVGNDLGTGNLLMLSSGSSESARFWVATDGTTSIDTATTSASTAFIINQSGSGDLISASVSGSPVFTVTREGNVDITGDYLVNGSPLTASNWQRTDGSLAPLVITDAVNIGATATGSALIHFAGTSGDSSWINNGNFGVGTDSPGYTLDVGGDMNISGALRDNGSAGTPGQILSSTGTGIQWIDVAAGSSNWQRNSNVLSPLVITDSINLGSTATISATVHLAGVTGENSFINTGNFGVGLTDPSEKLEVVGNFELSGAFMPAGSAGSAGEFLISGGAGAAPTWTSTITASSVPFSGITSGTNTGAAMVVDTGASLGFANSGTINASSLLGGTWAAPGTIGSGTPNTGAFTTLTAADVNITGTLQDNGSAGTPGQILSSTGTGIAWIDNTAGTGFQHWQRNDGALSPTIITDAINLGNVATASAVVHLAGVAGDDSFINGSQFGLGLINPAFTLDISGDMNLTGAFNSSGDPGTPGQILSSTGTGTAWIDNTSGDAFQHWQRNDGVLSPTIITDDLAIGGTATSSALFQVSGTTGAASSSSTLTFRGATDPKINVLNGENFGIQTSPGGDAGLSEKLTILSNGNVGIGTTGPDRKLDILDSASPQLRLTQTDDTVYADFQIDSNGDLIIGVDSTTNQLVLDNGGSIGVGTTSPLATLDIRSNLGTIPVASFSGSTSQAALIVDQSGSGDIFSASSSGQSRFTITANGTIDTSLGEGIVLSDSSGVLSVTGLLPIARGGTNNNTFSINKFVIFDGTSLVSSSLDSTSFESSLTFENGLTRTGDIVTWGGTLNQTTTIAQAGFDVAFTGTGNFGIGVASPAQKFDVAGFFVVDTVNSRVGIGTNTPTAALDIAGATSTITNSSGDITFNAASNFLNFSGDSLTNILDATLSGQLRLGNFTTAGTPTANGTGSVIYNTDDQTPQFWNGSSWQSFNTFFNRNSAGFLYPKTAYDSIHIGGDPSASSSALIRLSTNNSFNTFFARPVAIGFTSAMDQSLRFPQSTALQLQGDLLPKTSDSFYLGDSTLAWKTLYLSIGINDTTGTQLISIQNKRLTGGTPWNIVDGARIGDTSNTLPGGVKLYVAGAATISGTLGVVGNSNLIGDVTVGGGTGKIDVGTVDPPFTINGEKYGTYMAGMIGIKEEVMGKVTTSEYIPGLGYRALLDLDGQPKGSDLWLFSKTTNLKTKIDRMAVLLTSAGQGKTWYEIDEQNKILAIYSSTPSDVIYRLTAPRFDEAKWSNVRTSESIGFVINDPDINNNIEGTGLLNNIIIPPELLAQVDGSYKVKVAGNEVKEESSFFSSIIANLKVGTQVVTNLLVDNLTVRNKLISPIADIDQLKVNDATISGTLYADNIQGKTVDNLTAQLDLLDEKYSTASAILSDLQAKYTSYDLILGSIQEATVSGDPLALSPLATTSATIPSDLALESLNVHTILANDIMANGAIFAQSISSFDTDLFIQPTGDRPVHLLANLMTLYPDGKVVVNGDVLITGTLYANALDTRTASISGSLALGKGEVSSDSGKLVAIFDDNGQIVGSVDASGSANFGQLVTGGLIIASGSDGADASSSAQTNSNTTIGTATIATGSAEIHVASSKVTDHTLIYITPISDTDNKVLYVKSKQTGVGFTVAVPTKPNQVNQEISFNYWLIQTK